jgi:hypothetical protein
MSFAARGLLSTKPSIDLLLVRKHAAAFAAGNAPNRQTTAVLPAQSGPDVPPEVRRNLLPRVEPSLLRHLGPSEPRPQSRSPKQDFAYRVRPAASPRKYSVG